MRSITGSEQFYECAESLGASRAESQSPSMHFAKRDDGDCKVVISFMVTPTVNVTCRGLVTAPLAGSLPDKSEFPWCSIFRGRGSDAVGVACDYGETVVDGTCDKIKDATGKLLLAARRRVRTILRELERQSLDQFSDFKTRARVKRFVGVAGKNKN